MNDSPWSAYGRLPARSSNNDAAAAADDPVAGVVNEVLRGQEKLEQYLNGVMREYFEIHSGDTGYRSIIDSALTPSERKAVAAAVVAFGAFLELPAAVTTR